MKTQTLIKFNYLWFTIQMDNISMEYDRIIRSFTLAYYFDTKFKNMYEIKFCYILGNDINLKQFFG